MRLNTERNIQSTATLSAFLCVAGGGLIALIDWHVIWLGAGAVFGIMVALWLLLTETTHTRQIETKQVDAQIEINLLRAQPQVIDVVPQVSTNYQRPMVAAPRPSQSDLVQVSQNRMVRVESEPVRSNGATYDGWPADIEALQIAFDLMLIGKLPTRKNFTQAGLNSGSRYENIRAWLVGAGLAQDSGDGNPTLWTSDVYDFDMQDRIKSYLTNSPTLAA